MDPLRSREDLPRPAAVNWRYRKGEEIGRYRVIRPLGHGRAGQVYLAADTTEPRQTFAVKVFCQLPPEDNDAALGHELRVYRRENLTDFVPKLYGHGTTGHFPFLVLEPVQVFEPTRRLSDRKIRRLFLALAEAIDAFHRAGLILCDFKIGNLGFVGKRLVLIDFDAVCTVDESLFVTAATFTKWYVAPEVWQDGILTPAGDVFGLGHALEVVANLARTSTFRTAIDISTASNRTDRPQDMTDFKNVLLSCKPLRSTVKIAALTLLGLGAATAIAVGLVNFCFNQRQISDELTTDIFYQSQASVVMGQTCFKSHKYKDSVRHLERALSIKGFDNAEAHGMLAECYYRGLGTAVDLNKAREHAAHAARLGDARGKAVLKILDR